LKGLATDKLELPGANVAKLLCPQKRFVKMAPGHHVIKLFTSEVYDFLLKKFECLSLSNFQPCLMYASKAGSFPSEATSLARQNCLVFV
jgi:hypothetical protein